MATSASEELLRVTQLAAQAGHHTVRVTPEGYFALRVIAFEQWEHPWNV
jgi:hypothetical protein